ncbi:MAG TPA: DUF2505 domain-containing protein [Marmoricola sp.]|nr:DUF2505 domain-containing protein [Marmoricola sp.]
MRFHHQVRYDAPVAAVRAMLADPAFREASAEAQGVVSADVGITTDGERMSVVIDQVQPTAGVPGFARKFAGETTRAVQTEEWTSTTDATIRIETPGKPTSITGSLTLRPDGSGTVETMEAEIKVKVPLIGGRLEALMGDLVAQGMDREHEAGVDWLGKDHG